MQTASWVIDCSLNGVHKTAPLKGAYRRVALLYPSNQMHPSVVEALVIDHKSARLVAQQLHHVVGSVYEHEYIPAVQVPTHVVVHYPAQHVEVLAHVRRLRVKPELRSVSKTEHGLYAFEDCVHHRGRQAALDAHVRAGNRAEFNAHPVLAGWDALRFSAGCGKCRRRFHPGRQAATSYGQEPLRNFRLGVLPLPPEVLVLWNAFLFQQGLD